MSRIYDALNKAEQESKRSTPLAPAPATPTASSSAHGTADAGVTAPLEAAQLAAHVPSLQPIIVPKTTARDATGVAPAAIASSPTPGGSEIPVVATATAITPRIDEPAKLGRKLKADKSETTVRLQIFSPDGSELLGAEEFRRLRTKLQAAREKQPLKTVVVTSALPSEGKTFVTVNLAQTLTMQHRARVLVIDADFRKPQVHAQLRVPNGPGLCDYLEGRCDLQTILNHSANTSLDYILGGPVSSRPAELAGSTRFSELLTSIADEYEWVLVDTPPVLPVTDAAVIARHCDAALLVVAAGQTPVDLAQTARKELQETNLVGVVLNRATRTSSSYKRYHYYSYSHGTEKPANTIAAR